MFKIFPRNTRDNKCINYHLKKIFVINASGLAHTVWHRDTYWTKFSNRYFSNEYFGYNKDVIFFISPTNKKEVMESICSLSSN